MQKQLQLLRDLQELDTDKRVVDNERKAGADEQQALKDTLGHLQEMIDGLAGEIEILEGEKSELLAAMALEQENVERSEARLPQIKTQKEYVAVLKEVDTAKKLAKDLQTQLEGKDEALESLLADKTEKDQELAERSAEADARCAEIDDAMKDVNGKLAEMDKQREGLLKGLPTALRKRYDLLMARRGGIAIVEARRGACLGCHMHLPPQMFNSLFVLNEIQSCPHCNRLLYVTSLD